MEAQSAERLLAVRVADGDRHACAELVHRYHAQVYRMMATLCRDEHQAEDLTQETFAACWAGARGFDGRSSLGAWLRRIAYHKFIDSLRRRRLAPPPATVDAPEPVDPARPVDALLADEAARNLRAAVDALPAGGREVIVLHYLEGLSFREVAYVLDEPAGTVKWRVSAALGELRRLMKDAMET